MERLLRLCLTPFPPQNRNRENKFDFQEVQKWCRLGEITLHIVQIHRVVRLFRPNGTIFAPLENRICFRDYPSIIAHHNRVYLFMRRRPKSRHN